MRTKGGAATRAKAQITTQNWSGRDLDALLYPRRWQLYHGVLLRVPLSASPQTQDVATTAAFIGRGFHVLLALLVPCVLSGLGDLMAKPRSFAQAWKANI